MSNAEFKPTPPPPSDLLQPEARNHRQEEAIVDLEVKTSSLLEAVNDLKSVVNADQPFSWQRFKDEFENVYDTFLSLRMEKQNKQGYFEPRHRR